ncbi:uncharacterized protein DUF429 [Microterricola gilva]|uniref:Uncharacterized protein DUF429 n=1 Tax=Microterricola gilva TaxID=393267 RepID=A0A4Q8APS6_9MICO|nr:DUF429 domain-containing protein [Microterricola gilva]RZU66035.1 uncharacterized protein DUF429 [Microterricola gilva]
MENAIAPDVAPRSVLTAGVDLAAEPKKTALAIVDWSARGARLVSLAVGVDDAAIVDAAEQVDSMGIDCAFGWPDDFVAFVSGHAQSNRVDLSNDEGMAWRRRLAYRETDREVHRRMGRWPLSVATDRLGLTAMHCAALLDAIGDRIGSVDRSGAGKVAEVYPGASLRIWGLLVPKYRVDRDARERLLQGLTAEAPWLDLGPHIDELLRTDDALDALLAALTTRAHLVGQTFPVPEEHRAQAAREGWIALPSGPLSALLDGLAP